MYAKIAVRIAERTCIVDFNVPMLFILKIGTQDYTKLSLIRACIAVKKRIDLNIAVKIAVGRIGNVSIKYHWLRS